MSIIFDKYVTIPNIIEAIQITETNKKEILNKLDILTIDNNMRLNTICGKEIIIKLGDWIIKEKKTGILYIMENKIFANQYKKINNNEYCFISEMD